jgi:hypothetical protein
METRPLTTNHVVATTTIYFVQVQVILCRCKAIFPLLNGKHDKKNEEENEEEKIENLRFDTNATE